MAQRGEHAIPIYQMWNACVMLSRMRVLSSFALFCALLASASPARAADQPARDPQQVLFEHLFPVASIADETSPPERATFLSASVPQAEPHPKPAHTGFGALVRDTASDFGSFPRRKSTWVILGAGLGAAALVHPADDYVEEHIVGSKTAKNIFVLGKYLGSVYVQAGLATGLYLVGRFATPAAKEGERTNKLSHLGFDLMRGLIVSQAFTQGIKYAVRRDRPTGECCAFPSGHASAAFATASILERHFGYRGAWPTFVAASYVAASRLIDDRHFLSDVVFGAALGMASGWTVVGRHGRENFALLPVPVRGGVALTFTKVPREAHARSN